MQIVRIWDLPTRLFHWALAACVVGLIVTGTLGGNWLNWHLPLGYSAMTLLLFRVVWGFIGGHWSRFGNFLYGPSAMLHYLRGKTPAAHGAGHSPLAALSVFAMLSVLLAQVGTGLISDDQIATFGPLMALVSSDTSAAATSYHKNVGKWLILSLLALHLAAIFFYTVVKRQAIARTMFSGNKTLPEPVCASKDTAGTRLQALGILIMCAFTVRWVVGLGQST